MLGGFHGTSGGGSKILLPRRYCCLCTWWVSWDLRRRQQNPASEERLLPLILVGFMGSMAEAAKSCSRGKFAAFVLGGFHGTSGGGSKILLPRRVCCLRARWVSWDLRRRQQNPASEASLLPSCLVGFMGPMAEAAKSCSRGEFAAFVLGGFHGTSGGGSKILLPRHGCCLCAWWVLCDLRQRQLICLKTGYQLPYKIISN